ncbi:MAG: ATP-binding protein [Candidatus Brocadiales bacterium]|nr:ATP-binding protein [Candidatus Brocadiales bacterium]
MSKLVAVGLTKGPGEQPNEFTFISRDKDRSLKVGEFIEYSIKVEEQERHVLSRIIQRKPLRQYPDPFLGDAEVDPKLVASLVGYRGEGSELFEVTGRVIGYYDKSIGDFINPRVPPIIGSPIFISTNEDLVTVLSKKKRFEIGSATIGSLLSREQDAVPINLDLRAITGTHLSIIANTGAGKSYLASVIIEEMMMPYNRAAVLIVDPHGEYNTIEHIMNSQEFADGEYRPVVKIYKPGDVKVRVASLSLGDFYYLLPNVSERMEYLLRKAIRDVSQNSRKDTGHTDRWTHDELQVRLRQLGEGAGEDSGEVDNTYLATADALIWRIDSTFDRSVIFDNIEQTELSRMFTPGQCSVLQLNEVGEKEQQVMVAALLRRIFKARSQTIKGNIVQEDPLYLPYPVFVLIEEAHHFAPANANIVSTNILKQILAEGRKFGVAVGLISQRPGKLDPDVLSQCNTQCLMRIVNPVDQARVAESIETIGRDLLRELPALTKGQAIIAGEGVNTPVLCRVRTRISPHGAETSDAPSEWMNYFSKSEMKRRKREKALPAQRNEAKDDKLFK